jgi:hypothetical protein
MALSAFVARDRRKISFSHSLAKPPSQLQTTSRPSGVVFRILQICS